MQRYALQEVIKQDILIEQRRESMRFKVQAAIAHPESTQRIFSQEEPEYVPDFEEYDPDNPGFSQEGIDTMLAALETFGFHLEDM